MEKFHIFDGDHFWKRGKITKVIRRTGHGDIILYQLYNQREQGFINAEQAYLPLMVATSMKYAEYVNCKIPELDNWRGFLSQKGWNGKIEVPSIEMSGIGAYPLFVRDYQRYNIHVLGEENNIYFGIVKPHPLCSQKPEYQIPVIDLEGRLVYCSSTQNKKQPLFELNNEKYYSEVEINKDEARDFFMGLMSLALKGIDSPEDRHLKPMVAINMFWEYEQMKKGKTFEEIFEIEDRQ